MPRDPSLLSSCEVTCRDQGHFLYVGPIPLGNPRVAYLHSIGVFFMILYIYLVMPFIKGECLVKMLFYHLDYIRSLFFKEKKRHTHCIRGEYLDIGVIRD